MLENLSSSLRPKKKDGNNDKLPLDVRDRELLKKKASELDTFYTPSDEVPENIIIQEVMSYMRKVRDKKKNAINITYPITPPFRIRTNYIQSRGWRVQLHR